MLDPVSIIAAISFALQCGDLLLTGFHKLKEKEEIVVAYKGTINEYKTQLDTCMDCVASWCQVWGFPGADSAESPKFPEETLKTFWTPDGYKRIQEQFETILTNLTRFKAHLEGKEISADSDAHRSFWSIKKRKNPDLPSREDWKRWQSLLKKLESSRDGAFYKQPDRSDELPDPSLLCKIYFALFRNKELSEKISRLEKSIRILDERTRVFFNHFKGRDKLSPVNKDDVMQEYFSLETVQNFTTFACNLYECRSAAGGNWHLELRNPGNEDSNALRWTRDQVIHLDFTLHFHQAHSARVGLNEQGCRRFRIHYNPETDQEELNRNIRNSILRWAQLVDKIEDRDKIETLWACERLSRPIRSLFVDKTFQTEAMADAWRHDQARLLVAFTNWMILLLNTPWTEQACCCRIRFERIRDGDSRYVLSTMNEGGEPCHNVLSKSQKVRVLGLALSEIILRKQLRFSMEDAAALACPSRRTSATSVSRQPSTVLGKVFEENVLSEDGTHWKPIQRFEILQAIKAKTSSQGVRDAVEFCFEPDIPGDGENTRAEITQALRTKVLAPLLEFFQTVDDDRRRYADTPLRRQMEAKSAWPACSFYDSKEDCRLRWTAEPTNEKPDGSWRANAPSYGTQSKGFQVIRLEWSLGQALLPRSYFLALLLALILAPANIIVFLKIIH